MHAETRLRSAAVAASISLLKQTGHELHVRTRMQDMPRTRREFSDAYHRGRNIWVYLPDKLTLEGVCNTLLHEVAHAIMAQNASYRYGRDWQPEYRSRRGYRCSPRAALVEDSRIEKNACDAQYVLFVLLGMPTRVITEVQHNMSAPSSSTQATADQVLAVWTAAGLQRRNVGKICIADAEEA